MIALALRAKAAINPQYLNQGGAHHDRHVVATAARPNKYFSMAEFALECLAIITRSVMNTKGSTPAANEQPGCR